MCNAFVLEIITRQLPCLDYAEVWQAMLAINQQANENRPDELWLLEHPPVFTLGLAAKEEHILQRGNIPIVQCDRGGQVTYHGPGQLIAYPLLNIKRLQLSPRRLVTLLEETVIAVLAHYGVSADSSKTAPGVYVNGAKIASIGLRIRRGRCYHGIALNLDMDLSPFSMINPCGYQGLQMVQLRDFIPELNLSDVRQCFADTFCEKFGYNQITKTDALPPELKEHE